MIGQVGGDSFGKLVRHAVRSAGIDPSTIVEDTSLPTGVSVVMVNPEGEHASVSSGGANLTLSPSDIDEKVWERAKVALCVLDISNDVADMFFRIAAERSVPTVLTVEDAGQADDALLAITDYVIVNQIEAMELTDDELDAKSVPYGVASLLRKKVRKAAMVTLGAVGVLLDDGSRARIIPGFRVKTEDTTAAGEAFSASCAVGIARGTDVGTAIRTAAAAWALTASRPGGMRSLPTERDLEVFLAANP